MTARQRRQEDGGLAAGARELTGKRRDAEEDQRNVANPMPPTEEARGGRSMLPDGEETRDRGGCDSGGGEGIGWGFLLPSEIRRERRAMDMVGRSRRAWRGAAMVAR